MKKPLSKVSGSTRIARSATSVRTTPPSETRWKIGRLRRRAQSDDRIASHLLGGDPPEQALGPPRQQQNQDQERRRVAERGVDAGRDKLGDTQADPHDQDADRVLDPADDRRRERL